MTVRKKDRRKFIQSSLSTAAFMAFSPYNSLTFLTKREEEYCPKSNQTWIEIQDKIYGAKPGGLGPLGGGVGYKQAISTGTVIANNLDEFIKAVGEAKSGQIVFVPGNAIIDFTTYIYIDQFVLEIPEGVTIASDRGINGSLGALLTSDALKTPVMIRPQGPNVRISGFRIEGPNPKRYLEHHAKSFGPGGQRHEYYYKFPTSVGIECHFPKVEIDNCDLSGFSRAAISLKKGEDHMVHHNMIHKCQYNGLGYGISHDVASSTIEYNLFDENRHSIAGTGKIGCSYIARHNVEMGTSLSHCFDMHGGRDRKDGTQIAGTNIEIYNNTFRAPEFAIGIRGKPENESHIYQNWFVKHQLTDEAVRPYGFDNITVFDNIYGKEPTAAK
ncbi:right-handed parallel beta-helix repeat-containing protein [Membranihabitans maritimus]|uniref:right-handed parallel beta-helix repeat-containing protein n=1 Tax=Membranihabitans maritimus TaxID=2904244 RepID=UPI001F425BC3|nr:right-handed parallel beta-helix repeat-containing protein [Membranihabitans maritimus]